MSLLRGTNKERARRFRIEFAKNLIKQDEIRRKTLLGFIDRAPTAFRNEDPRITIKRLTTKRKTKRLMTLPQKKALIKAIGKNKSMKPASRKAAIRKIKAKKTRKA